MARWGLLSLEFYDPARQEFTQAHMHARYVLLSVMLEGGVATLTDSVPGIRSGGFPGRDQAERSAGHRG